MGSLIIVLEGINALLYLYFGLSAKDKVLRAIGISFLIITLVEIGISIYFRCSSYLLTIHSYFDVVQLFLWGYIFYLESKQFKSLIKLFVLFALTFFMVNLVFLQKAAHKLTTHSIAVNYIVIACLCILFFYEKMIKEKQTLILYHPMFWFAFGIFFMNICNAPYWAMYNYLNDFNVQLFGTYDRITKYITVGGYIMCTFIVRWKKSFQGR